MSDTHVTLHAGDRSKTERLADLAFWIIVVAALIVVADNTIGLRPYDSTDNGARRSGMRVHADAQTGCEYLSVPGGGITPRLAPDGRQTGCVR